MSEKIPNSPKIALLGHGPLAQPSFAQIQKHYNVKPQDQADLLIVANYGRILKKDEIEKPKYGAINIHPSLLPIYRGPSPVQAAILHADKVSGVTFIKMDEHVDHGPILKQYRLTIEDSDYTKDVIKRSGDLAALYIVELIKDYVGKNIKMISQVDAKATFTRKLISEDGLLNLNNATESYNKIRALSEDPGAFVRLEDGSRLKIITAKLINNKLIPVLVQKEGKNEMGYKQFLNGYRGKDLHSYPHIGIDN